ncbi:hypothetical protein F5880DRAFT_1618709 [Lentinula raphanica]|nr:hypothetical protein F5880DRAFT_1618709 [Lentinula raphanica]
MLLESRCNLQTLILGDVSSELYQGLLAVATTLTNLSSNDPGTINQYLAPLHGSVSNIPAGSLTCLKVKICLSNSTEMTWEHSGSKLCSTLSDLTFEEADETRITEATPGACSEANLEDGNLAIAKIRARESLKPIIDHIRLMMKS